MVVCTTVVQVQQHDVGDESPFDVRIVRIIVEAITGCDGLRGGLGFGKCLAQFFVRIHDL